MSIRRRIEIQRTRKRDVLIIPTIEDVGRIVVDETVGNLDFEVFNPDGSSNSTGASTPSTVDGFSHITAEIGPFAVLGESFRLEQEYRLLGEADDEKTFTHQVFFDVVTQEWQTELNLDSLRNKFPPVGRRLAKHGAYYATAKTAEEMAAIYISNAMDKFDNVLRSIILETRIEARVSLVPDPIRFDRVVADIALGLIFKADLNMEMFRQWIISGMKEFEKIELIGYDADENFIKDSEVTAPDRAMKFGLEFFGDF